MQMILTVDDSSDSGEERSGETLGETLMESHATTILCADDDPEVLEMLREYLARQGFHVVTAPNGVEALLQVTRWLPRAAILDLFMPWLGGLEVLDRIKRLDPEMVVMLISGVPGSLEMVTQAAVSVAGCLRKPFDLRQLLGMLVEAGVTPPAPPENAPHPRAGEGEPRTRKRVLVVDDDPEIRGVFTTYLRRKGLEALEAESGEEALCRIPEFRPHLVLLDIAMPGLSGLETLRRIKAVPFETSVVMISGIEDYKTARQTLALGASDYVTKPVDFRYLDSVLEAHLFMSHLDADAAERPLGDHATSLSGLGTLPGDVAGWRTGAP